MITFNHPNPHHLYNLDSTESSVSTLLIPENLLPDLLLKKAENNNNLSLYLKKLLRRYRCLATSGLIPEPSKVKTEFQNEGLNLKKINFRPRNSPHLLSRKSKAFAWIELGELALAFGKSLCWIFCFLLKLDILGLWSILVKAGLRKIVPTLPNLELTSFWGLRRFKNSFERSFHYKV